MLRCLARFVLLLAVAVAPLHSIASAWTALLCDGRAHAHTLDGDVAVAHHAGGENHHRSAPAEDGADGTSSPHACCSPSASIPQHPADFILPLRAGVPAIAPVRSGDLHIPDLPQRPPLA